MTLKFSTQRQWPSPKKTPRQERQWKLFAALGYTIAIRGYLLCWRGLVRELVPGQRQWAESRIDDMITVSKFIEADIRQNLRNIK